ncbi:siderophore ABC transporter substrate-binding protein [Nesterenkonia ebinurensis]|uniref:siderophore ABC transporter substrate-binding protein n=1 Tax=Nesterenkonia ebinurensis TaxID=2608252 RepID=UPI00123CBABD|nr:ABC transporter substrate-binding protein [Nesterenkonia ebinurensis]
MTLDTITAEAKKPRTLRFLSVAAIAALALTACNGENDDADNGDNDAETSENGADEDEGGAEAAGGTGTITIEDDHGTHEFNLDEVDSIVATDNRSFRTLEEFGVELSAAPLGLARETSYGEADIPDLGSHREPDFEALIAAEPDLVINGQRFGQFHEEIQSYAPEAVVLQFDEGVNNPDTFIEGLIEKTEALGEIFGEQEAAQGLIDELNAEVERAQAAYDGEESVLGVLTTGGVINYAAPGTGRSVGPVFPALDLVPALEDEAEDEAHGDDISVEAIAESNPDWIIVMDRDAMNSDEPDYQAAAELIEDSPALQEVTAVQEDQIIYAPNNMYLTEDIQAYIEFFGDIADAFEAAQ